MKKAVITFTILFLIGIFSWLFYFQYARGEFLLNSASTIDNAKIELNEPVYLGYKMKWTGNGKPTIDEIRLIKNDGSYLEPDDPNVTVVALIEENASDKENLDAVTEKEAIEQGLIENLLPAENYLLNQQEFNMVLKVMINDENYTNNLSAIEIVYTILGKERENQFLYEGFLAE